MPRGVLACLSTVMLLAAAGCGGESRDRSEPGEAPNAQLRQALGEARQARAADFPPAGRRTLQEIADEFDAGPTLGLATSVFVPGTNRLAFGVMDDRGTFVYGKTAVYVGRGPDARAKGPYPAPADSLITEGRFRSRTAASETDPFAAIYSADVELGRPGSYSVVTVTKLGSRMVGATARIKVKPARSDTVPALRERAPAVPTDTTTSARGDIESIDTRVPPDDMHDTSLEDVIGTRPVVLLFATPQLCQSRVCGPVVDIAAQLKAKYGERVTFIHQEVYVDNDADKGLRPPLREYGLPTEPWLFTIDRDGRVAARLEGSFGFTAFDQAIQAAL